jgi:tripartite-type tricarboxylate transporter receptor subunit TctC
LSRGNGIKLKHLPFKGTGESAPAIMGGHVDIAIGAPTSFLPLVQAGRLRALALFSGARSKALPEVATFSELKVKGDFMENWVGCFAAAGTPKTAVDLLVGAADKVVKSREFAERIEKTGGVVRPVSAKEFQSIIENNKQTATEIAREIGIYRKMD